MDDNKENQKNAAIYNLLVETKYSWDNYLSLPEYLKNSFEHYHKHVMALEGYVKQKVFENLEISVGLQTKIFEVVIHYLRGEIPAAYDSMKVAFELVENILIQKSAKCIPEFGKFVFKARDQKEKKQPPTSRTDMFHIPFEKRHLVNSQRFSISGIPSIYLGESIYNCYEELQKPALDKFWVSLFHFPQSDGTSKGIKLVDLTFAYQQHKIPLLLHEVIKNEEKYAAVVNNLVNDILLWPLIMACSITCRYPEAPFKQEYIVPQMLYQLCSASGNFNGVKFYSTKLEHLDRSKLQSAMINYALPAQDVKASGYCPILAGQLCLTEPIKAESCCDEEIESKVGYNTTNGLPIISARCDKLKDNETILALDRMTMHFDNLMLEKDLKAFRPLYGYKEDNQISSVPE